MIIWLDRLSFVNDNKHKKICCYVASTGKSPFIDWLAGIKDPVVQSRIMRRVRRMILGNYGDCRGVGESVF